MSQVASDAVFHRYREHVTARHDRDAFAAGADGVAFDIVGCVHGLRTGRGGVGGHRDRQRPICAAACVVEMQFAVQLVNYLAAIGARPPHVPVRVMSDLPGLARLDVVAIQVEYAAAIGVEINGVADPHGIAIRARILGDLDHGRVRQIKDVEIVGPTALIALFAPKIAP